MDEVKKEDMPAQSMLDQVRAERERIDKLLPELKSQVARLEELKAREMLGGQVNAGSGQSKPEVNPKDYASDVLKGKYNK